MKHFFPWAWYPQWFADGHTVFFFLSRWLFFFNKCLYWLREYSKSRVIFAVIISIFDQSEWGDSYRNTQMTKITSLTNQFAKHRCLSDHRDIFLWLIFFCFVYTFCNMFYWPISVFLVSFHSFLVAFAH